MRTARFKSDENSEIAYYHCVSRAVDGRRAFAAQDKEQFVQIMRAYELFSGVRVVTYCILDDRFSILLEVPQRPVAERLLDDRELLKRLRKSHFCPDATGPVLARFRQTGRSEAMEEIKEQCFSRMWDVSWFMRMLKQRFTQGFNSRAGRRGTLWEGRFRSLLVEGTGPALVTVAAYIDLAPVRSGKGSDPKDYRWSGYAEAVRGGRLARKGLQTAVEAWRGRRVAPQRVVGEYRSYLNGSGDAGPSEAIGTNPPRKFARNQVERRLVKNRDLELSEALRCPVRAFSDGVVLGSRSFVEEYFHSHRDLFSAGRKTGARKLRGINSPELFVMRDLQVRALGVAMPSQLAMPR
jgi:hypothetical protein